MRQHLGYRWAGSGWLVNGMQGVRPPCLRVKDPGGWIRPEQASSDPGWAYGGQVCAQKGSTGRFRFKLVATNGQVIATSEAYESKASAIKGIESVKRNAPSAEIDDQTDK
jgi:uncharacterized protein